MKPTTKEEMVKGIEEACLLAVRVSTVDQMIKLNQQLAVLKTLARHLPDNDKTTMPGGHEKQSP